MGLSFSFWFSIVCLTVIFPKTISSFAYLQIGVWTIDPIGQWKDLMGLENEISQNSDNLDITAAIRNIGLTVAAAIVLPLAIWRSLLAHKSTQLTERGQNIDRFQKGAEMLGDEELSVREAGIFALKELAQVDPIGHYLPVQKTLCAFLRNKSLKQYSSFSDEAWKGIKIGPARIDLEFNTGCTSDMIEAVRAFSDLRTPENLKMEQKEKWRPDLSRVNFILFPGHSRPINFEYCSIIYSKLDWADLFSANLTSADFFHAVLSNAFLQNTNLDKAIFTIPILDKGQWPAGWKPGEIGERGEYNFVRT